MPAAVPLAIVAAGAIGSAISAHEQGDAADTAANLQSDAAANTLRFQREQAALTAENANRAQQGNYGQWAARQSSLQGLDAMVGLPARQIPPYVPLATTPGAPAGPVGLPGPSGTMPAGRSGQPSAQDILAASQGLDPQDPASLAQVVQRLNQQGYQASIIDHNGAPSDHKVAINGAAWTLISSNGYQPGTYRWDPYVQVPAGGMTMPTTAASAPTNGPTPPVAPLATGSPYTGTASAMLPFTSQPQTAPLAPPQPLYRSTAGSMFGLRG